MEERGYIASALSQKAGSGQKTNGDFTLYLVTDFKEIFTSVSFSSKIQISTAFLHF